MLLPFVFTDSEDEGLDELLGNIVVLEDNTVALFATNRKNNYNVHSDAPLMRIGNYYSFHCHRAAGIMHQSLKAFQIPI